MSSTLRAILSSICFSIKKDQPEISYEQLDRIRDSVEKLILEMGLASSAQADTKFIKALTAEITDKFRSEEHRGSRRFNPTEEQVQRVILAAEKSKIPAIDFTLGGSVEPFLKKRRYPH